MNIVGFRPCSLASVMGKVLLMQLMVLLPRQRRICRQKSLCIFFDIKGAFGSAWHPGILKKLKAKSCPDRLLNLILVTFLIELLRIRVNIRVF